MRRDLDSRGRQAAEGLRSAIERAELTSTPPGLPRPRRSGLLRPAWIVAILLAGSAIGLAMVIEPSAPEPTAPPTTTTLAVTTSPAAEPEATPTTAAPVMVVPPTTIPVDSNPPILEITSPADGATLSEKTVTFAGITEPGAEVFAGKYQADVKDDGTWRIVLVLSEGANRARFTARDAAGNQTEASITVNYLPPTTTTTAPKTTKPEIADFTAFATFGSCVETPPYDVYYGTGHPGSKVHVESTYGSGSVEVAEDGQWEVKVFFPTAPSGEPFSLKIYDDYGRKQIFDFVYTP